MLPENPSFLFPACLPLHGGVESMTEALLSIAKASSFTETAMMVFVFADTREIEIAVWT